MCDIWTFYTSFQAGAEDGSHSPTSKGPFEERQKPSVEEMKKEVLQYALRPIADLDKHVVLEKIENLKNIARD